MTFRRLEAGTKEARSRGTRTVQVLAVVLARLLPRALFALVLLAGGGALLARVRSGMVTEPVLVAPGIVGERGSGAWLYAVRLKEGVALVDAGRDAKGRPIDAALARLGEGRAAVTDVLLTHGHPSETVGLAAVRGARVHAGEGDVPVITGRALPGNGLDRVIGLMLPRTTSQVADPIPGEKVLEVGGERVLAIPVPGHSLGSTAYLLRGVLFVGDAASVKNGRLVPGPSFMCDDPRKAERAFIRLEQRIAVEQVSIICSAHDGCSAASGSAAAALGEAAGGPSGVR